MHRLLSTGAGGMRDEGRESGDGSRPGSRFRVQGRVQGSRFRAGFRVHGSGPGSRFEVHGSGVPGGVHGSNPAPGRWILNAAPSAEP